PEGLFGLLYILDPSLNKQWFYRQFFVTKSKKITARGGKRQVWVTSVVAYKNQDQLSELLRSRMIRRLKKDCLGIPKKSRLFVPYEIQDVLYDQMVHQVDLSDEPMMTKIVRLQQAASGLNPYQ